MAVGHTDGFGSEAYNQRLFDQRVEAVKTYLVSKGPGAMRS
jgi:outer membrane protein OmpA-like peptidoglycan-associated protein